MADRDLLLLYSDRLLALAANIPRLGRLASPHGTGRRRSPTCGSTVVVDVRLEGGRIADFAQEVRACALGQAAAAVVGAAAPGRSADDLRQGVAALRAMLREGGPIPPPPWHGFEALLPARDHPNRHASVLLALEATLDAAEAACAAVPSA
ncbi:iron-sulfur cluster assembly scaffold protein [Rubellimicrobium sp. CFH 75288]|uniref:iron-sulfur cluster assembly scaffold protein n=1 Tax=Rubellimicrobium sp. CFH 75288 TaxID=2697034 RepID=UPI001411EFD2|nr:iron-sulfur cluster assembly scaffold protein [Rubellimicrobium sp. CFH 75288]NAZ36957.1 iron-sulfur cluster assembly scaffold protein [Rubellimicrobium sp. CFH 75288]